MTLPLKRPFIAACICGAIGGAFVGFNNVKNFSFGLISLLSLPGFIPPNSKNMAGLTATAIGTAMAFILAFVLTFILRFSEEPQAETITSETNHTKHASTVESKKKQMILASPLAGKVIPLTEVKDQVFSSNSLGKGVAIDPSIGELYAPADGTITTLFPTGHAVGITTTDGIEILMHIGLDTVELEGKGFNLDIKQEQKVKKGDRLVTFDLETIKTAGYSPLTPIVITNSAQYFEVLDMDQDEIVVGESLLSILK